MKERPSSLLNILEYLNILWIGERLNRLQFDIFVHDKSLCHKSNFEVLKEPEKDFLFKIQFGFMDCPKNSISHIYVAYVGNFSFNFKLQGGIVTINE